MQIHHRHRSRISRASASRPCSVRRAGKIIVARLAARGKAHTPDQLSVGKLLGEGSYGTVFEGMLDTGRGDERVVLKRVKARVEGAAEMAQMEHLMNVYASKAAKGSIAEFLGYCEVPAKAANYKLTEGLWLMWRYEGSNTLAYYLRRRDTLRALARDLDVPEDIVVPVAMRQLLLGLSALHTAGLVHRDVKPLNIIASERDGRLKLIDLGAAADLRTGTNYSPEESILDPMYCPPEQFVLPTDSPHLAKSAFALALSPMLWAQHKPDRFDSWSAGIVMLQLCLPGLRTPRGLNLFKTEYERADYDLEAWRSSCRWISKRDTAVLDADGGAGWALAQALLRPRTITVDSDGGVTFVNNNGFQRIGAQEALRHPFLKPAALHERALRRATSPSLSTTSLDDSSSDESSMTVSGSGSSAAAAAANGNGNGRSSSSSSSSSGGSWLWGGARTKSASGGDSATAAAAEGNGSAAAAGPPAAAAAAAAGVSSGGLFNAAAGLWRGLQDKLFDLEARMIQTASETAKQTTKVKRLEQKVAKGQADPAALSKEKQKLGQMQQQLDVLEDEKTKTASRANSLLSFLGIRSSSSSKQQSPAVSAAAAAEPAASKAAAAAAAAGGSPGSSGRQGIVSKARSSQTRPAGAAAPVTKPAGGSSSSSGGSRNVLLQAWESVGQQLLKLEGQLSEQQSKTEKQRLLTQRLQQQVKAGEAAPSELQTAQEQLGQMTSQLQGLQVSYSKLRGQATSLLARIGSSTSAAAAAAIADSSSPAAAAAPAPAPAPAAASSPTAAAGGSSGAAAGAAAAGPTVAVAADSDSGAKVVGDGGGSNAVVDAGIGALSGAVYAGLKFSSLAMRIAGDVVSSVKDDAGRMLKELEDEAAAKRARRAAEAAFLQLLKTNTPSAAAAGGGVLSSSSSPTSSMTVAAGTRSRGAGSPALLIEIDEWTTYKEAEVALQEEEAWQAVSSPERRRELFAAYAEALRQVAAQRQAKAEQQLLQLLVKLKVGPETDWAEVEPVLSAHPACSAIPADRRAELFDERVREVVLERACAAAAERAENDFRQLLVELQQQDNITASSTWPSAKPKMWSDIRYQSLPDDRRLELFNEFMAELRELQQQQQQQQALAAPAAAPARPSSPAAAAAGGGAGLDVLGRSPAPAAVYSNGNGNGNGNGTSSSSSIQAAASHAGSPEKAAEVAAAAAAAAGSDFGDAMLSSDGAGATADMTLSSDMTDLPAELTALGMSPEDLAQLQLLRWEQAKLRSEYLKMEEKLQAMEKKIRSGASSPAAAALDSDAAGSSSTGGSSSSSSGAAEAPQQASAVEPPSAAAVEAMAAMASVFGAAAAGAPPPPPSAGAAAAAAAEAAPPAVVVRGGEGDVSVEVDKEGMLVFKFAGTVRPTVTSSVGSSQGTADDL